ncbi:RNA helicase [Ascochyta rabiei]|uniref:ATP binding n=1 Tax=Didymella rabiei TaxID=5454 RepID=A0A162YBA8_DIDRA|nr:RNA helicase [Ascochyta rabiei]KZM19932.1 ATP binding [Ascochyta rabiei]UPX19747.1 RNA helicase [Ascochyta rabiei]
MAGDNSAVLSRMDTTDQILQWYSKLFSRRVDLVGDFAGSERFLIHGESLLLHCFSDAQIDFEPGLQLLHASYAVEKFLHGLVSRRCNFHIAFFDEYQDLCVPQDASPAVSEKYLLARAAIIRHLQVNLRPVHPDIEVKVFPSSTSEAFEDYLSITDVYFILCHDGASTKDVRKRAILHKDIDSLKSEDKSLGERQEQYKASLRTLIYTMMQRGYSAALVNGLEFNDTKAIASVLEHSRAMTLAISQTTPTPDSNAETDTATLQQSLATVKSIHEHSFTEREYLAVLIASKFASKSKNHQNFAVALLRHTALLSELSLPDRLMQYQEPSQESRTLILEFCQEARRVLAQAAWSQEISELATTCDVADLIDGRLFASCLQDPSAPSSELFQSLARAASTLCGQEELARADGAATATEKSNGNAEKSDDGASYRLLPFSNEVFDKHLSPVHLKVAKSDGKVDSTSATIFREVSHWHNTKPLQSKSGPVVKDEKAAKKALRRNQFFMAEMTTYAASLTNAVGKALEPETIMVGASKANTPVPSRPGTPGQDSDSKKPKKQGGKPGGKNKNQAKQNMLADIAASSKRKEEDTAEKQIKAWIVVCDGLEKEVDLTTRYEKAKKYLVNLNTDIKRKALEAEVRLYMLNVLLKMWMEHCRKNDKEEGLYTAALIFDAVRAICGLSTVTKTVAACLTKTIDRLKLPSLQIPPTEGDRKLPFQLTLDDTSSADIALSLSPEEFQLLYCGPYFDRTMDSAPDSRVSFEPDAWQRKVLDEIDARRSLLVVAPTSAGKTFISFYAMQKVLESSNDDVLVYVAPTKALVNQIAAEVQARFSKNYKYANSVWGIHTRDTRVNNPTGCQILVTVPHILQIMLLAPTNARSWSERVKWIIFDEVHCIGQAEDGLIWEQLLLMAPCPIIALSATVGNAEAFSDWLSSTQKAAGNELTMVQHKHRYSDLRKFLYIPPKDSAKRLAASLPLSANRTFARLGLDDVPNFTFMHPVASLTNRRRGMPSDFSLEARDCYFLWQSMSKHQTKEYPVDKSLTPSSVLPKVMRKADIIEWESGLKTLLAQWMADENSPFEAVRKDFSSSVTKLALQIKDSDNAEPIQDDMEVDDPASNHDVDNILPLLTELHQQDALPGIIFNYDRAVCERMCRTVLTQLEEAETEWKKTSPKWAEKLREWEEYKKEVARRAKQGVRAAKGTTKEEQMMEAANREVSPFATFDPDRPLEGFHFANSKRLSSEELRNHEKELRYRGVDEIFIQGLQRGIGVHHAGMNRKYRYAVEVLFRRGYLRVVIATGTLALGINMPCKTVVFSGDSIFLTALNYRQAAGRAGRRGFDSLGNVVFHGISLSKINKLISSRLPDLNGHFPITTTLVLRLFTLLHDSENSPFAVRCINALLSQPRVYLGGEESKMTVLHHLRFSIEYLRRQSLLDSRGTPLNFAGAVSHLYFTENSSFAFHALLKNGYFHELCAKVNTNQDSVLRELMLTMSHLFGRLHCRQADEEFVQEVVKGSPSVVFLPNMPENAVSVLRKHNKQTLDIFTSYVRTFVEQHLQEADNTLPLTTTKVGGKSNSFPSPIKVRSSFVALSGHNDEFESIHDLCTTSRSGIFLEEAVVPYVGIYPEDSDLPLNAYLYDFFMHGNATAVVTANRIRRGDIWFVLNDFSMVLATIVTSLTNFMNLGTESDLDFIDVRGGGDDEEEEQEDKLLPTGPGGDEATGPQSGAQGVRGPAQQQNLPIQLAKKKKKVVESWDEEAESSSSDGENWDDGEDSDEEKGEVAWDEQTGLLNVLKAFKLLKADFDTKFRAMWA